MADFSALKQSIQNYIKQNGNKEITGAILQNILLSMVTTMGDGAINDNASDISDIKGDIQNINGDITNINSSITDINGDITELNGNLSNEVNRAKGAETTTLLFSDGKLVFKNAAGTVLYQLSVDSFLSAITTRLNTGALYAGYATPSTTPATLTSQEVFYLATQAGTYTNFHFNGGDDPIVLTKDGIYFIVSGDDDDDWNAEPMLQLDDVPTASSNNAVKSGGVAEELALGAVYDVSAKNPTAGPNNDGKWESLSALLSDANLNTLIPTSVRKGGMSIKFIQGSVQSSDNKYVQYRLMANQWSSTPSDWQGVDDVPTDRSDNLVKSDGVYSSIVNAVSEIYQQNIKSYFGYFVNNYNIGNLISATDGKNGIVFLVEEGKSYKHNIPSNYMTYGMVNSFQVFDENFANLGHPTVSGSGINTSYTISQNGAKYLLVSVYESEITDVKSLYLREIGNMYDELKEEDSSLNRRIDKNRIDIESVQSVIDTKWIDKKLQLFNVGTVNVIGSNGVPLKIGSYTWRVSFLEVTGGKKYKISGLIPAYLQASGNYYVYSIASDITISGNLYVVDAEDVIEVGPTNSIFYNDYENSMEIFIPEGGKYLICSTNQVQQLYLKEGVKNIICWGDSLTAQGWPAILQNLVDNTYNVLNRGIGGQDSATIAGRQGGVPFYLVSDVTLPANTTKVQLPVETISERTSLGIASKTNGYIHYTNKLLCQGDYFNYVNIDGIECILTKDGTTTATAYYLQRAIASDKTEVLKAGSVLYGSKFPEARTTDISVVFIGQNGGYDSPDTLVSQVKKMINFSSCGSKFIAITSHGNGYANIRGAFDDAFGAKVLNLQWYLPNYGIIDAVRFGLATEEEMTGHTWDDGTLKPSDDVHLTALGYQVLANKVYEMMNLLGYFTA